MANKAVNYGRSYLDEIFALAYFNLTFILKEPS